jgi:exopolyphosphatase/guanosine-5'-triphosphate,3'-diphosphate pyrophosphatase
MALTREHRLLVSKLAAILRIADSLDRSHTGAIRHVATRIEGGQLVLEVVTDGDVSLDELALRDKSDLFEQLYGLEAVLRRIIA